MKLINHFLNQMRFVFEDTLALLQCEMEHRASNGVRGNRAILAQRPDPYGRGRVEHGFAEAFAASRFLALAEE